MTTEQKSSDDPSYCEQVTKKLDTQWREYAKQLNDENSIYAWYALLDSINISYSIPKYLVELSLASEGASVSSGDVFNSLHDWMITPVGIVVMVIETVALITFSVVGSLSSEDDANALRRYSAILSPYFRDLVKALKWAERMLRSVLSAASTLTGESLSYLLFPLGIALGVLAVLNRIWNRNMKAERKAMMKVNSNLHEEVSAKGCTFHVMSKLPEANDMTCINSYLFIQGYCFEFTKPDEAVALDNTLYLYTEKKKIFYAVRNKKGKLEEIEIKETDLEPVDYNNIRDRLERKDNRRLKSKQSEKIYKITSAKGYGPKKDEALYYMGADGNPEPVNIENRDAFELALKAIYRKNFLEVMKRKLSKLKLEEGKPKKEDVNKAALLFLTKLPEKGTCLNSFIYIQGNEQTRTKMVYINPDGDHCPVKRGHCEKFERYLHEAKNNNNLLSPTEEQTKELIEDHGGEVKNKVGLNIEEWEAYSKDVAEQIARQSRLLQAKCLLSAAYSGLIDGGYACLAPMGIAVFIPPVFLTVLIFSCALTLIFIATRIYEESDFQRKLLSTETKVKLMLLEKKLDILLAELGNTSLLIANAGIDDLIDADNPALLDGDDFELTEIQAKQTKLVDELGLAMQAFEDCRKELQAQVCLTYGTAALDGLRSGVAAYSAITSGMFLVATICLICATPVSPFLVLGCAVAGLVCMIGFLAHALIKHSEHLKKVEEEIPNSHKKLSDFIDDLKAKKYFAHTAGSSAKIEEARATVWNKAFDSSPESEAVVGFEMVRSLLTGPGKALKLMEEVSGAQVQDPVEAPVFFAAACLSSVMFAVVLALRALARGFGRGDPVDAVPNGVNNEVPVVIGEGDPVLPLKVKFKEVEKNGREKKKGDSSDNLGFHPAAGAEVASSRKHASSPQSLHKLSSQALIAHTLANQNHPAPLNNIGFFLDKSKYIEYIENIENIDKYPELLQHAPLV